MMDEDLRENESWIVNLPAHAQNRATDNAHSVTTCASDSVIQRGRQMRWPNLLHGHKQSAGERSLNVDGVVAAGMRDRSAAYQAIRQLQRERKLVEREQRAIHAKSRHVDSRLMRGIVVSDSAAPELAASQISEAMRDANESAASRDDQAAALDERLEMISGALDRLYAYLRDSR